MLLDWWVVVIGSVGAGLGLLLGAGLLALRHRVPANAYLAVFVLALAGLLFGDVIEHIGILQGLPGGEGVFDGLLFAVGPAAWLYTLRLIQPDWRPDWRRLLHFLPAAAFTVLTLVTWEPATTSAPKAAQVQESATLGGTATERAMLLVVALQMVTYLILASAAVRAWQGQLANRFSNHEGRTLRWLFWLLAASALTILIWVASWGQRLAVANLMSSVTVACGLFAFGVLGLNQLPLARPSGAARHGPSPTGRRSADLAQAAKATSPDRLSAVQSRLEALMQTDKPYLEIDLTLRDLADAAQATPHQVSEVLNSRIGMSFYDYINGQRVQEVQRCLADPAYDGQPILDLAMASGFASKATFNAVFKKHTGITPSAFRRQRR